MLFKRLGTRLLWSRFCLVLICAAGIGLAGSWFLSAPAWRVSAMPPARLTLQSPIPIPPLDLAKSVDNSAPQVGSIINYTLTYRNSSDMQAFNVRLYDFLPPDAQLIATNPPATLLPGGTLMFTATSVGPTTEAPVNVQVRVPEGYANLLNHALVMADGVVAPTVVSLLTPVIQQPSDRLRLAKVGYSYVLTDSRLVYTLRGENTSYVTVRDVTLVDVLPTGVSLVDASPQPDRQELPLLRWSLGDLGVGEWKTVVITTTSPAVPGGIVNAAIAGAWQNVMTQTLFATRVVTEGAILRVTKEGSAPSVRVGDTLVYTIRYGNAGNKDATGVVLTDTLPSDVVVVGVYPSATTQTSQQLVWNLGVLSQTAQEQIVITTTVGGKLGRVLLNVVDIAGALGSFPEHTELETPVPLAKVYLPILRK